MQTLLRLSNISKSFSGLKVLDQVSMDLRSGEVHILAGENGAGKSTLMKILSGIYQDYEGEILLNDQLIRIASPHQASQLGIAVIHQELSLIDSMSVLDNLYLGRDRRPEWGFRQKKYQRIEASHLCARFNLSIDLDRLVEDYSLSTKNQIEILKALTSKARIFIMDEPTSALGLPEVEKLHTLIGELKAQGCGIVYISHRMEEIYRIADRITVLRDGKYIGTEEASKLPQPILVNWMIGRDLQEFFSKGVTAAGEELLKLTRFTARLNGQENVRDVSFSLRAGEVLGIAGLQGSGKSELLSALFGAYPFSLQGKILLNGTPFIPHSPSRSINQRLMLLTSDRKATGLVLGMSVEENMTLARLRAHSPYGFLSPSRERKCAKSYIKRMGIRAQSPAQAVHTLSGGNQQKVVLAKCLEAQPLVLLLDEPTRGVDIGAKHEIYELISQCKAQGIGIILVTSEMPELLALSDRVLVMHRGHLTAELSGLEATQERILQAAMGEALREPRAESLGVA